MASEKNITMKEFNGTDYDTLYPKTKTGQVIGLQEQFTQADKNVDNKILNFKNKNIEPVGTVKLSVRNDLGPNWLKCDGNIILPNKGYDTLEQILGAGSTFPEKLKKPFVKMQLSSNPYIISLNLVNNKIIGFGAVQSGTIYYKDSIYDEWKIAPKFKNIKTPHHLEYVNGYYVATGDTDGFGYIAYCHNLGDSWVEHNINSNINIRSLSKILYVNGRYYLGSNDKNCTESIYFSNDLSNTKWTLVTCYIDQVGDIQIKDWFYNSTKNKIIAVGAIARSQSGAFSFSPPTSSSEIYANQIGASVTGNTSLYFTERITNDWVVFSGNRTYLFNLANNNIKQVQNLPSDINRITPINNKYQIVSSNGKLQFIDTSLLTISNENYIIGNANVPSTIIFGIGDNKGNALAVNNNKDNYAGWPSALPNISIPNVTAYIKAKDDTSL